MDDVDLIKSRVNIVDLISEYLPLKKAGVNFKAPCPFHEEKTPSFMVSPERGIFHCFGCGKSGDIFSFLQEKEGVDFKEALETLAQRAGVVLKNKPQKDDGIEKLFEVNDKSQKYYQYLLLEHPLGKNAFEYLKKRGLSEETIKTFGIGYAPNSWESLTKFLKKRQFKVDQMVDSGLCVPSNRGLPAGRQGCYDRFRGRIMFPLKDIRGKILGFSGRILDVGEPKYINTPQTIIFDKRNFLLGLDLAKSTIKEKNEAIIVEGEMDFLVSFQSGVKNVVASKGTALTKEQLEVLKKYTDTISLCFDTDLAGDNAARRGIEMADNLGFNIKVIEFDGAKDPAELCLKNPKLWEKAVKEAVPIYDFYLNSIAKRYNLTKAADKKLIAIEVLPIFNKISDNFVKEHYIQKLAAFIQIKEELIRDQMVTLMKGLDLPKVAISDQKKSSGVDKNITPDRQKLLEEYLIALILHLPKDHTFIPKFPETLFTRESLKQIYVLLVLFLDSISFKSKSFKITEFIKTCPEQLIEEIDKLYLIQIDERLEEWAAWEKEIETVVSDLKKILIKTSLEKLSLQIKNAQEFAKMETLEVLNKRFRDLSVKLKNL